MRQPIIAVAAMTRKGRVIGKDDWMPWDLPDELAHFRRLTSDGVVIMGGKTYRTINRPMPKRENIVVTRRKVSIPGCHVVHSIDDALALAHTFDRPIYVIGGAEIYTQMMPHLDKMFLSFVKEEYKGDTVFPAWKASAWKEKKREDHGAWEYVEYARRAT